MMCHVIRHDDVGMSGLVASEAECLANLTDILSPASGFNKSELSVLKSELSQRATTLRAGIAQNLWNERLGIFANKFKNGTVYPRISPTSFYALMAGAATDTQAERVVKDWLLNKDHFCVAPDGNFAGLDDSCYWGLPSIDRSDPAFPLSGYWRSFVWGPLSQLVWWSLERYDHVPAVQAGRKAMVKQLSAMMLNQWHRHRHICENFGPDKDHPDCTGGQFYHWGALPGIQALLEAGKYGPSKKQPQGEGQGQLQGQEVYGKG